MRHQRNHFPAQFVMQGAGLRGIAAHFALRTCPPVVAKGATGADGFQFYAMRPLLRVQRLQVPADWRFPFPA